MRFHTRDFRDAWRRLLARPGYTSLSVLVLSLGLGAMLFLLGAINGLIIEPLPFPDGDRLVAVGHAREGSIGVGTLTSNDFLRLKGELRGVEAMGAYNELTANLSPGGGTLPKRYNGTSFSAPMLGLLGVSPIIGRGFDEADDAPGAALTVLLAERVWREDFNADPSLIGRAIMANGEPATVIGVLPAGFAFPFTGEVWLPRRMQPGDDLEDHVVARLAVGTRLSGLAQELEALAQRLGPELDGQRDHRRLLAVPLKQRFVNEVTRQFLWMMFATGVLVLLLACANVANLQVGQTLSRRRELAVRGALGASRASLLYALLAESLLLSLTSCAIALVLAHYGGQWLLQVFIANEDAPVYYARLGVDARMFGFALLAAVSTTLLAGLPSALRASKTDVQAALRDGDKGSGGGFARLARGLVVAEIALTVVLLVGAGMFIRGLHAVMAFDFGTSADPARIVTGRVGLFPDQFPTAAEQLRFFERVAERLRADPQVESVSVATVLPGTMADGHEMIVAEGAPMPADGYAQALAGRVDEHFLDTYGIGLVAGRDFDAREQADSAPVALIDRRLAEKIWPGRDPLGRRLLLNPQREQPDAVTVIGVTAPLHLEDADDPVLPTYLLPLAQKPARFATIAVRTRGDAAGFAPKLEAAVRAEDADTPTYWLRTQEQAIRMGRVGPVVLTQIFTAVGLLALILAAAGLYGVLAFAVEQRTREIGIRRAIGAGRTEIAAAVGRRLLWQMALGLAIGVALALPWSAVLESPLTQTRGYDVTVFAGVLLVIVAVAVLASLAPLRRALRIDPMAALRHE